MDSAELPTRVSQVYLCRANSLILDNLRIFFGGGYPPALRRGLKVQVLSPGRIRRSDHPHDVSRRCRLNGLGSRSSRISVISWSIWLPFRRLQEWQHATRFSHVDSPPLDRGSTWSSVSSPAV